MDVSLVMFKADGNRRDFPVRKDRVVLGRKNTCDLRIPLSSVSRQHCEIRIIDGVAKIRDLGSSNGTYHNHTRVQESVLSPGDEIVVGPVVFTIQIDGIPEQIEPVRTIVDDAGDAGSHASVIRDEHHQELNDGPAEEATQSEADVLGGSDAMLTSETVDVDDPLAELEAFSGEINPDDALEALHGSDSEASADPLEDEANGSGKSKAS